MQKDKLFAKIGDLTETTFNEKKLTHLTRRLQGMSHDVQHLHYQLRQV